MARVIKFERGNRASLKFQPTEVVCHYSSDTIGGRKLIQLDTFGSKERENPGKQSQTLQLDALQAEALIKILRDEFHLN